MKKITKKLLEKFPRVFCYGEENSQKNMVSKIERMRFLGKIVAVKRKRLPVRATFTYFTLRRVEQVTGVGPAEISLGS